MKTVFGVVLVCVLGSAGCSREPGLYTPPIDRRPIEGATPELAEFVEMGSPSAKDHILRDILGAAPGQAARWTNQRPALRFHLSRIAARHLRVEFAVAEATFKDTGPVQISFKVNGNLLDKVRYDRHGEKVFEKVVPETWLRAADPVIVEAEIDKVWVSKSDGARLGVLLARAGFVR